jgi:hypothetical protein
MVGMEGKGANLPPSSSFLHSVVRILGLPTKVSSQKWGYYNNQEYWWGHSFNLKAVLENCICSELVNTFDRLCSNKNLQSHPDPFYLPPYK